MRKAAYTSLFVLAFMAMFHTANGGTLPKTWSSTDILRPYDINANMSHIHNVMVGQHGARLVDADVSGPDGGSGSGLGAQIAHTKFENPHLMPKAWAITGMPGGSSSPCAATPGTACTLDASSRVTSITGAGSAGLYKVNLAYTPLDATYAVQVTAINSGWLCKAEPPFATATPNFYVHCGRSVDLPDAGQDGAFSVVVFDADN